MPLLNHPCPVCGEAKREFVFVARDHHYGIPGEWNVARCTGCAMLQLDPMLSYDELLSLYPDNYYAFQENANKHGSLLERAKRFFFASLFVRDPEFRKPGRVLDSGCGTGWSLVSFKKKGWDCVGVEPNATAAKFGRSFYDVSIAVGTVLTERFPDRHFDYIRSNHSLEHDPDAGRTIAEFRRIISDDGKLLIGVPNIDSLPARWFGQYWWYLGVPVHTYQFSLHYLTTLLTEHNFTVETVRYAGNCGGLIGSLQIYLNRKNPSLISTDGFLMNTALVKVVGQLLSAILNAFKQGDAIEVVARPARNLAN